MKKLPLLLLAFGISLVTLSLTVLFLTFFPLIQAEINYLPSNKNAEVLSTGENIGQKNVIFPIDESFGIVIPKIGANSKVIAEVNPFNENEYQWALTKGVAHAKGTFFPGQEGNTFIFSHSSANFFEANKYNSVFYLLGNLEKGDEIYLFYKAIKFKYLVSDKKIIESNELSYLQKQTSQKLLTLMTCWPPGTSLKRLIVTAELSL